MARGPKNKHDITIAALTPGDDFIRPGDGLDWNIAANIDAGAGNDTVMGSGLADTIMGGDGDDLIDGGDGADIIDGGAGNDTVRIHAEMWSLDLDGFRKTIVNVEILDLSNLTHYFDSDADGVIDASRDLTAADVTFDGTVTHVSIVENDPRWDVGILGVAPTLIFAA